MNGIKVEKSALNLDLRLRGICPHIRLSHGDKNEKKDLSDFLYNRNDDIDWL